MISSSSIPSSFTRTVKPINLRSPQHIHILTLQSPARIFQDFAFVRAVSQLLTRNFFKKILNLFLITLNSIFCLHSITCTQGQVCFSLFHQLYFTHLLFYSVGSSADSFLIAFSSTASPSQSFRISILCWASHFSFRRDFFFLWYSSSEIFPSFLS